MPFVVKQIVNQSLELWNIFRTLSNGWFFPIEHIDKTDVTVKSTSVSTLRINSPVQYSASCIKASIAQKPYFEPVFDLQTGQV